MIKKIISYLWIPIVLVALTFPIILPYFHPGYFPTHDGEWAVVRLGDMFREIRDHQFPPRYSGNLDFGYGYPLFNFAYPLPYYIGLVLYLLKFSFIDSIKFLFAGSVLLSVGFMYLAAKEFWQSKKAGFVSALLFAYFPYRLVDLYVRGSIGECFAFIFFSALFWFAIRLYKSPKQKIFIPLISLGVAGLILSHNIMAILFFPLFLLFIALLVWKEYRIHITSLATSLSLGLLAASFFWAPALVEKNLILLSKIPIADRLINYVTFWDLLFRPWGYGIPEVAQGGFTYQIGWPQIVAFLFVLVLFTKMIFQKKHVTATINDRVVGIFIVITVGMILMMFPFTNVIWKTVPLLKEINYPWTFLGPIGFIISFLSGYIVIQKKQWITLFACILCISALLLYLPNAKPQKFTYYDSSYYLTNDGTTTSSSEYTPLWVKELPLNRPTEKVLVLSGQGTISNLSYNSKMTTFSASLLTKGVIRINTIYYPGWRITVDGMHAMPDYNNSHGVMDVTLSSGTHFVSATFSETPLRLFSDILSLCSVILIIGCIAWFIPRKRIFI